MRKIMPVFLFFALATFLSAAMAYSQDSQIFTPTFIDAKFAVNQETFVADEMITLEGVVAFDQAMSIHWDELTPERLNFKPFQVLRVAIGPQKPYSQSENFFADYRMVQITLAPPSTARNGVLKIPSFRVGYSYQGEKNVVRKQFITGPWTLVKAPMKMSVSLLPNVLHLGERAELTIRIQRDKNVKVLNQFLGLLKDESAAESEKAEIKRWAALLEAKKESAFNLLAPDVKPFKVLDKSVTEVDKPNSVVSVYTYKIAYYEAVRPLVILPQVKLWYVLRETNSGYQDPEVIASSPIKLSITSRLIGKDRRLEGPQALSLKEFNLKERYLFGYAPMLIGVLLFMAGLVLIFRRSDRKASKKAASAKPISFRRALKALARARLGTQPVKELRTHVFKVIGAALGMTEEEADAKTADEMVEILKNKFPGVDAEPISRLVNFLDKAMVLAELNAEGVEVPEELISEAMSALNFAMYPY